MKNPVGSLTGRWGIMLLLSAALFQLSTIPYAGKQSLSTSTSILLPIEVLGEEGKVVSRSFTIDASTASAATSIWLMINNLSYQDKGSVKVNDGVWTNLNHSTVDMPDPERLRGGMVHGGYNTIRATLPISGLRTGENTIYFRFNESDGISMGYRIVKMNLLSAEGGELLSEDFFEEDDPSTWQPPYAHQDSIDSGRDLWYNAELWTHYLPAGRKGFWYDQVLPVSKVMKATCTSCHTQDGRDLEIFSYSNESIIERAKFHRLTESQGKKIASYIRSLSSTANKVGRYGRPWDPPYQPGPSVKDKPIEQWAAGAGLEAVLEQDRDMLPYLFPDGVTREEVRKVFDSDLMADRTTLPLAIQFPDWKHWLPIIHPIDAYTKGGYIEDPARQQKPLEGYQNLRDYLEAQPVADRPKNELKQRLRDLWGPFRKFHEEGSSSPNHWRTKDGSANQNLGVDVPWELANTSLARLYAVKNFEVVNEFELQDKAHWWVIESDQPGDRQWPINAYSVFEVPAHFTALNSRNYENQPYETGLYETTAWYNLQFVLNGGNGFVGGTTPTDFNYNNPFIGLASEASGIDEPLRYFSSVNYMYQIRTWSQATAPSNKGFRIRFQGPWTMLGMSDSNQRFYDPPEKLVQKLDEIVPGLARWVLDAMLWQFVEEVERYDINTWPRVAPDGGSIELDPSTKSSVDPVTDSRLSFHWADKMYDIIPRAQGLGADCEVMNRIIDWSKSAWPLIDFEKFKETCSLASCTAVEVAAGNLYKIKTKNDKCISTLIADPQVSQQTCADSDEQQWLLADAGEGYYFIRNMDSNHYLQSPEVNENGQSVAISAYTGGDNQKWRIVLQDNCTYGIASKASYRCLDLYKGLTEDGTKIQQWTCGTGVNQQFDFEFVSAYEGPTYTVSITALGDVTEGDTTATFQVNLDDSETNSTGIPVTGMISWSGTASGGSDYVEVTTFSIANGENATEVPITIIEDTEVEGTETMIATIASFSQGEISTAGSATISISDDDGAEDETSEEVPTDGDLTVSISLVSGGTEATADAVFEVTLDGGQANTTGSAITGTITWSGTATSGTDYTSSGTFSIDAGASRTKITVSLTDDEEVEVQETVIATLSDVTGAAVGAADIATGTIIDDDATALTISVAASGDVIEGADDASFTISFDVSLVNGRGAAVTGIVTLSGTSSADTDFTNVSSFSIADGESQVIVTVPVLDDSEVESQETLIATISNPSVGSVSANASASINIGDNDSAASPCVDQVPADSSIYFILTMHDKAIDVARTAATNGNNVRQWEVIGDDNQQWQLVATGEGYYHIRSVRSGRSLEVPLGALSGTSARVWDFDGEDNQHWQLTTLANCKYMITSRSSGLCLDLQDGSAANDADLLLSTCDDQSLSQQFRLELLTEDPDPLLHQELPAGDAMAIFPNPATTQVTVTAGQKLLTPLQVRVLDLSGRLLSLEITQATSATIDVRELQGGVYVMEVTYNGLQFHKKIWIKD